MAHFGCDEDMTGTAASERNVGGLSSAHRMIRVLDPSEGPFAGALVTDGDRVAVCIDAAELSGWEGWHLAGSDHVVAPVDIVRRGDGHDVLLPWCTERVTAFLARRSIGGERLTPGECGTLLVSLLRALGELGELERAAEARGTWWLTDDGRPVLVIGSGDMARLGVVSLVEQMTDDDVERTLGRLLAAVRAGLEKSIAQQPWISSIQLLRWEREVLEIAAPRALRRETAAPEPALLGTGASELRPVVSAVRRAAIEDRPRSHRMRAPVTGRTRDLRTALLASMARGRAALRDRWHSQTVGSAPVESVTSGTMSRAKPKRRRSLLLAGAAAAAVLVAGLLWPSGDADRAEGGDGRQSVHSAEASAPDEVGPAAIETSPEPAAESPSAASPQPVPDGFDPASAAIDLWARIWECDADGDPVCSAATEPGSAGIVSAIASTNTPVPAFTVIDEYGGVAVVRADLADDRGRTKGSDAAGRGGGARILVLARLEEKWLVRDVYDVADQPG